MTYRKFLFAGAVSAAIGLVGGSAIAQVGQQQPRPMQVSPINGEEFLNQLEGRWNVQVTIYDIDAVEGRHVRRPLDPARPGVRPDPRPTLDPAALPQVRTQIEQAFIRAGVSATEARRHAQELATRIQRESPTQAQMQTWFDQTLTQAGVTAAQARLEAERLAQQVQVHMQIDGAPLRPEDDPTAPPIRPDRDRPGVTPDRPGVRPDRPLEAQFRGEGTANRSWTLNDTFLQEELTFTVEAEAQVTPTRPGMRQPRIDLRNGDEFEGLGMFAFEPVNGEVCMVWADNTKSMLHYGIGRYDTAQQAMVFYTIDPDRITLPHAPARPGVTPTPRPGPRGPAEYQDRPGADRPGAAQQRMRLDQRGNRVVLRIIDDNEHIVHVYRDNGFGQATRIMELTYTRN